MGKNRLTGLIFLICIIHGFAHVAFAINGDPWTEVFEKVVAEDDVAVEKPQKKVVKSFFFSPKVVSDKVADFAP
ncbi:MAG: hypothetical protein AB1403_20805, partial [Candidatus Riflebacteria bacterium]